MTPHQFEITVISLSWSFICVASVFAVYAYASATIKRLQRRELELLDKIEALKLQKFSAERVKRFGGGGYG